MSLDVDLFIEIVVIVEYVFWSINGFVFECGCSLFGDYGFDFLGLMDFEGVGGFIDF